MAQTPVGTLIPYCSVARLFVYHDWQQIADDLRDGDGPRPTRMALLDGTLEPGSTLVLLALAASGELESACRVGNRYSPDDLMALTGSGLGRMEKLVADLTFWACEQRRKPASADPRNCPGALQAIEELDRLRDGERIFGFVESGNAGLPSVGTPDVSKRPDEITLTAGPLFGGHSRGNCNRRGGT